MSKPNQYQHRARKRFGQNFLSDDAVIHRIARAVNAQPSDQVVEIGPGQGALPADILDSGCTLNCVELDRDLIPILNQRFSEHSGFSLHQADALEFDFASLRQSDQKLRVIGNLPYNISTPLIFKLLELQAAIKDMHFMLQLEVVNRLAHPLTQNNMDALESWPSTIVRLNHCLKCHRKLLTRFQKFSLPL